MKNRYQKTLSICAALVISTSIFAQSQTNNFWTKTSKSAVSNNFKVNRNVDPIQSQIFNLNLNAFKTALVNAPVKGEITGRSNLIMAFPTAKGNVENYRVMESSIMHPDLAAMYPMIKTYVAQGVDDPTAYMRFSVTQFGLHTMSLSGKRSAAYIDPYTTNLNSYIIYDRKAMGTDPQPFECLTPEDTDLPSLKNDKSPNNKATDDQKMRTFRLAQTCTAEYGNIFAVNTGTELADIQAQMTITINRVNTVYEVDLGITLQFIAQQNSLIFFGSTNADPWSGEYNTATQNFLNTTLNDADYDIGHNFNTSGGGNAGCIGCVCVNGQKGSGMTGRANPTGDPFDIDYVAHEMGHQFGGYHTMNTCSRSGSGSTEVEPASGSSVMGYAGICSSNVQSNSDAHFNYVNVRDISANVQPGGTSTCAAVTVTTNNPPTANAGADYNIPKSTAFVLEGAANDADGMTSLTYEWSQNDPEQSPGSAAPQSNYAVGPMYRAKLPIVSPNRYMPRLQDVIAGNLTPQWEVTPSVGRVLNFSFMVRDNDISGAQTADDLMKVTVDGGSGPFAVTSQTSNLTWNEGTNQTITWNVANTTAAPVSAANVDIFLSLDGGFTYPITLATGVPNNGTASVLVPTGAATTTARVMVRGAGNIFYALNSTNFSITASEFVMVFAQGANTNDVCAPNNATYNFTYNTFLGFNQTTTFSATGNPVGTTVTFSPATAQNNGTPVTVTISGITGAMAGNTSITVVGTASTVTKNTAVTLNVFSSTIGQPTLSIPTDGANSVVGPYNISWIADVNATAYDIEIATDAAFTNIVESATGLTISSYLATTLSSSNTYFWRVKSTNQCANGNYSTPFTFTTASCNTYASANVPVAISGSGTPTVTSTLTITTAGTIADLDVVNLVGTHSWINDLTVTLTSPLNTTVTLWDGICDNENDFDLNLDDGATPGALPCPPVGGGTYQPANLLSAFNGESVNGTWTLTISDTYNQDGGSLDGWGLDICLTPLPTGIEKNNTNNTVNIYPNPTNNIITIDLENIEDIENLTIIDVQGKLVYQNANLNSSKIKVDLNDEAEGIYILKIQYTDAVKTHKIIKQ